jgi:Zn-dependent protease
MALGAALGRSAGSWVGEIAILVVPLVAGVVLHEVAHGAVAYGLGDPTAARAGRLTLNPIRHVDPFGTIVLPGLLMLAPLLLGTRALVFGWARPVPVDFRRLRSPRRDTILVALAGPFTNLVLATASAFVFVRTFGVHGQPAVTALRNLALASLTINAVLAVFNLLPVPPLDGGRVLSALLPVRQAAALGSLERFGMLVILLLVMNTNLVGRLVHPLLMLLVRLVS